MTESADRSPGQRCDEPRGAPGATSRSARAPCPPGRAGRGSPRLDGDPTGGGRQRARRSSADGARRAGTEWSRGRSVPARTSVGHRPSQRRPRLGARHRAITAEPTRDHHACVERDHAALLHRLAALADRARVRYAVTGVAGAHLLSAAGVEPPSTLQIRVSGHVVEISRRLRQEPGAANETDGDWSTTIELWADTGNLGTFDALRVCGVNVAHPIRVRSGPRRQRRSVYRGGTSLSRTARRPAVYVCAVVRRARTPSSTSSSRSSRSRRSAASSGAASASTSTRCRRSSSTCSPRRWSSPVSRASSSKAARSPA